MGVVNYKRYVEMLENAQKNNFAYPAINIVNSEGINAALLAFKEANSDGIIQVSTGGAKFGSGLGCADMVKGAIALADYARAMAAHYDINVALHTDHCHDDKIDSFLIPLIEESERRVAAGGEPVFNSHMYDGSTVALGENLANSRKLLERCAKVGIILEVEIGVVGGEEDGHDTSNVGKDKLYTSPEDMVQTHEALNGVGTYMLAATFGNVHGVYKPGNVVLKPEILKDGQAAIAEKFSGDSSYLVFHGGSGSELSDIHATLDYGVIKMNVDTDTQYAFSRPLVDHFFKNYDGMLKIEGEVGNKKVYDPRSYLAKGERSMADRIKQACDDLRSTGTSMGKAE